MRRFPTIVPTLLVVAAMLSCESPTELVVEEAEAIAPAARRAPAMVRLGAFALRVSAWTDRDGSDAYLLVSGGAGNVTPAPVTLQGFCMAQLRLRDPSSGRVVWRKYASPLPSCTTGFREVPPNLGVNLTVDDGLTRAREILGDSVRAGTYAVGVLARLGADTVELNAGTVTLSRDLGAILHDPRLLHYRTATTVEGSGPRMVVTRIVATNLTDRWIGLKSGGCFLHVRAYRDATRRGPAVWYSPGFTSCNSILLGYSFAPGRSFGPEGFTRSFPLTDVLGDSLPEGRYWFTARIEFLHDRPDAGFDHRPIEIPAGSAELVRGPDPLPSERTVDGVRYRLDSMPARTLSVTNTRAEPVFLKDGFRECSGYLRGHVDATTERWYEDPGVWVSTSTGCAIRIGPAWLEPGETRTFPVIVRPDPRAPAGPLTLTLRLWMVQDPGTATGQMVLAAGTASPGG